VTDDGALLISALWLFALGHPVCGGCALALVVTHAWRHA